MIQVDSATAAVIESNARTFVGRLLHEDGTVVPGVFRSATVYKGSCGDAAFQFGALFSSYIEVVIDECGEELKGQEVMLQLGTVFPEDQLEVPIGTEQSLYSSNGFLVGSLGDLAQTVSAEVMEWTTIGHYMVTETNTTTRRTSISAVGKISSQTGVAYSSALTFPATVGDIVSEIETLCGITVDMGSLDTTLTITQEPKAGLICREMLAYIAGLYFGYCTENADGTIAIRTFKMASGQTAIATDGDRTSKEPVFKVGALNTVTGVKVIVSDGLDEATDDMPEQVSYTYGVVNFTLTNPYMTEEIFEANVGNAIGLTYWPGTVDISLGDYRLEPSDWLAVRDVDNVVHPVPCMSVTHTFDGGISSRVVTPPITDDAGATYFRGAMGQLLTQISYDVANIQFINAKQITADRIDLTDLFAQNIEVTGVLRSAGKEEIGDDNPGFYFDGETGDAEIGSGDGDYIRYENGVLSLSLEQLTAIIQDVSGAKVEINALANKITKIISDEELETIDNCYGLNGSTGLLAAGSGVILIGGEKPITSTRSAVRVVEEDVSGLTTRMESVEEITDEQSGDLVTLHTQTAEIEESVDGIRQLLTEEYVTNDTLSGYVTSVEFTSELESTAQQWSLELTSLSETVADLENKALYFGHNTIHNEDGSITMNAVVYRFGEDVTSEYPASWFEWINRSVDGDELLATGYSYTLTDATSDNTDGLLVRLTIYTDILPTMSGAALLNSSAGVLACVADL